MIITGDDIKRFADLLCLLSRSLQQHFFYLWKRFLNLSWLAISCHLLLYYCFFSTTVPLIFALISSRLRKPEGSDNNDLKALGILFAGTAFWGFMAQRKHRTARRRLDAWKEFRCNEAREIACMDLGIPYDPD